MKTRPAIRNLVAKHCETFNKPKTFTDRKRAAKAGKTKHKSALLGA